MKNVYERVKFYTGLPSFVTLRASFHFVSCHVNTSSIVSSLPNFQQFLLTLMKLHLNLFDKDFRYRCGISQTTVSRYFKKYCRLIQCFHSTSGSGQMARTRGVKTTMPVVFRKQFKGVWPLLIVSRYFVNIGSPNARAQPGPSINIIIL